MANKIQNYIDDNYQDARREMVRVCYLNEMFISPLSGHNASTLYCSNTKNNIFIPYSKMTRDQFIASMVVLCEASGVSPDVVKDLASDKEGVSVEGVFEGLVKSAKKSYVVDYDVEKEGPLTSEKLERMQSKAYASTFSNYPTDINGTLGRLEFIKSQKDRKKFTQLQENGVFNEEQFNLLKVQLNSDVAEIEKNVMAQYLSIMAGDRAVEKE